MIVTVLQKDDPMPSGPYRVRQQAGTSILMLDCGRPDGACYPLDAAKCEGIIIDPETEEYQAKVAANIEEMKQLWAK